MKNTNAIEKALKERISKECKEIVDKFITDLEELSKKYGGSTYYDFQADNSSNTTRFTVQGVNRVAGVLHRMILENYSERMLAYKSKELINKLELYT